MKFYALSVTYYDEATNVTLGDASNKLSAKGFCLINSNYSLYLFNYFLCYTRKSSTG